RVAAGRLAAGFMVDLCRGFRGRHPCRNESERPVSDGACIERAFLTPIEVASQDVRWVEAVAGEQAFRNANCHADRPANAITGSEPDQHPSTTIAAGKHYLLLA